MGLGTGLLQASSQRKWQVIAERPPCVGAEQGEHGAPGRGCSHVGILRSLGRGGVPPAPTLGTAAQGAGGSEVKPR